MFVVRLRQCIAAGCVGVRKCMIQHPLMAQVNTIENTNRNCDPAVTKFSWPLADLHALFRLRKL
jgi:hypothetical protein